MTTSASDNTFPGNNNNDYYRPGLTKREYFAAMAMQGMIAANNARMSVDVRVEFAVMYADTLIRELNKEVDDE